MSALSFSSQALALAKQYLFAVSSSFTFEILNALESVGIFLRNRLRITISEISSSIIALRLIKPTTRPGQKKPDHKSLQQHKAPALMNRYRTIPGFTGQSKASPSTTCQKCLKKGHYSYECKESVQTRPYVSRPSRTQQLLNPKLAPRLASDATNDLLRKTGIADEHLAKAEAERAKSNAPRSISPGACRSPARKRPRSMSSGSENSISTISTNRSRSRSRKRVNRDVKQDNVASQQVPRFSQSQSRSPPRKRKHDRMSSESVSRSPSRSRSRDHKSRRHRKSSPDDRGRSNAQRRGSHRSRSRTRSLSMDKSRVAKERRSLDEGSEANGEDERMYRSGDAKSSHRRDDRPSRRSNGIAANHPGPPASRKERSLSPYSRRLALTQSMNMTR